VGAQTVDEVGGLEEVEEVVDGLPVDPIQLFGERGDVEDTAIVIRQIEKDFFYFEDAADTIEGGHVAFEHLVHDVLAQEALATGKVIDEGGFGESAAQQVFMEVGGEWSGECSGAGG